MNNVAKSMAESERALGHDSRLLDCMVEDAAWEWAFDADVHIAHTMFPKLYKGKRFDTYLTKPLKKVVPLHGTPEHVVRNTIQSSEGGRYAPSKSMMIQHYDLQHADAVVTFWPRHQWIYETMVDKGRIIDLVPLGVDRAFWAGGASRGKYQGLPSVWTGENAHDIKDPFDILTIWPKVWPELDDAFLHACYVPQDQHHVWLPLAYRNGAHYHAHIGSWTYPHEELRNIWKSVDYFLGFVQKGDFNRISHEANAAGAATISFAGNEYSDFWVTEGDQRTIAKELVAILKGDTPKRAKQPVPDQSEMAAAMVAIYERLLDAPKHAVAVDGLPGDLVLIPARAVA